MNIKEARHLVGLSQIKMSELLGIPRRTIEDWERGLKKPPEYVERLVIEKLISLRDKNNHFEEDMSMTPRTNEIHEAYVQCKKVFEPSIELLDELTNIEDEEEKLFYHLLTNFFMQQKQKDLIKDGVC